MKHYKVVVFGSRDFDDYELLCDKLVVYFQGADLTIGEVEIVEGGARGADNLAMRFAEEYNLKHTQFPADWDKHGKSAGYIRNSEMAKYCDFGIAFWDGKSKGTKSMIEKLERLNKEVIVIHV